MVNINLFSQILSLIDRGCFNFLVRKHDSDKHHMGISRVPSKSNLSYMNAHRDHLLFRDLYVRLLDTLWQKQTHRRSALRMLKYKVLLMDATVIPLCLSVFDWAKLRSAKGAVKLHTILNYDGCI